MKIKEDFGETPLEVVFTKGRGDGTTLTREFLKKGFRKVVAIGGDGTINEVANSFFFKEEQNLKSSKVASRNCQDRPQDNNIEPVILRPINSEAIMGLLPSGHKKCSGQITRFS
jgi:hypothetical protein